MYQHIVSTRHNSYNHQNVDNIINKFKIEVAKFTPLLMSWAVAHNILVNALGVDRKDVGKVKLILEVSCQLHVTSLGSTVVGNKPKFYQTSLNFTLKQQKALSMMLLPFL